MIPINLSKEEVLDFCHAEIVWAGSKAAEFPAAAKEVIASILELIYKKGSYDANETMQQYVTELVAQKQATHNLIASELKPVEEIK